MVRSGGVAVPCRGVEILLLHPGAMGASVGASLQGAGARVYWVDTGRSSATRQRAERARLTACASLAAGLSAVDAVVSVCPPHAAVSVAEQVAGNGFAGTYVDANAVAPATAQRVAETVASGGATFVDGGIIGPPAWRAGTTRLYLSGSAADRVARWFRGGPLEAIPLTADAGAASGLKMAYAGWTKGSSALLVTVRALAAALGVEDALLGEWERSLPDLAARSSTAATGTAPKAWRFTGEMDEIAATLAAAGLPPGFHLAAADVYRRLADFKDADSVEAPAVLAALSAAGDDEHAQDQT